MLPFYKLLKLYNIRINYNLLKTKIETHPNTNTLSSYIDTMNELGIENAVLQLPKENYSQIYELPQPFLGHLEQNGGEFIMVEQAKDGFVAYYSAISGSIKEDWSTFKEKWSGIALLVFPETDQSKKNKHKSYPLSIERYSQVLLAMVGVIFLLFYVFSYHSLTASWLVSGILFTKSIGLLVSVLLLQNDHNESDSFINRFCSTGKNDCNKVLSSQNAKLFNWISWSELGVLYFAGGILTLILSYGQILSNPITLLFFLNLPTLFFSFYSIWYQYTQAKSWCRFCLITISLFWIEAFLFIAYYYSTSQSLFSNISLLSVFILCISFGLTFTVLIVLKSIINRAATLKNKEIELNKVKFNEEVVSALLRNNETKEIPDTTSMVVYGEKNSAKNITIVTNPTCPPCVSTHKKVETYLNGCYDDLSLNIIFSVNPDKDKETEKYKVANRIIQIYISQGANVALEAMNAWYKQSEKSYDKWALIFPCENINVYQYMKEQNDWCENNQIAFTPTVFFNKKVLHRLYDVEDFKYLI